MKLTIILLSTLISIFADAHGEDKPGPNGGYVRMPGAFHTEVVPRKAGEFEVFLLDVQFKNPATKDSTVSAVLKTSKGETKLTCAATKQSSFLCQGAGKKPDGILRVDATRENAKGNTAEYTLPLKFQAESMRHSNH